MLVGFRNSIAYWGNFFRRVFDHWEVMTYDPLKPDSPSNVIMLDVRKRKGLKPEPNVITEYEVPPQHPPASLLVLGLVAVPQLEETHNCERSSKAIRFLKSIHL
jgi:hypothetical protein